jgi:peroxiredoxin
MPLYNNLSPVLKATGDGKFLAGMVQHMKAVQLGAIAPDFTQPDTAGTPINLKSFRGKYVLVDFWASWCHPCRAENPNLVKAFNHYKGNSLAILSISLDTKGAKDAWLQAINTDGMLWTQVSDLSGWNNTVAKEYGVTAIPQNFLVDPQGKIVAKNLRGDGLEKKLKAIFGI